MRTPPGHSSACAPEAELWQQLLDEARRIVDETLDGLPENVRHHAETLVVLLEDVPSTELLHKGLPATLLGLFQGYPLRGPQGRGFRETTISLFLWNLWRYAAGAWPRYRQNVRKTYLHELGHYLGLDERDLAERNLD